MLAESLFFSAVLFMIGVEGVLTRRNAIIVFMCVELMLNAVNLTFIALAQQLGPAGLLTGTVLAGALLLLLKPITEAALPASIQLPPGTVQALQEHQGIIGSVANPLFDAYVIPFEIASVLLLAAIVGAVVLAKRKL